MNSTFRLDDPRKEVRDFDTLAAAFAVGDGEDAQPGEMQRIITNTKEIDRSAIRWRIVQALLRRMPMGPVAPHVRDLAVIAAATSTEPDFFNINPGMLDNLVVAIRGAATDEPPREWARMEPAGLSPSGEPLPPDVVIEDPRPWLNDRGYSAAWGIPLARFASGVLVTSGDD